MEYNNKKLDRTSRWINVTIAVVLCGFLIGLSMQVIDDVDEWKDRPTVGQFEDKEAIAAIEEEIDTLQNVIDLKNEQLAQIAATLEVIRENYGSAKSSYDNWLAARRTIGSPSEDVEVRTRVAKLDQIFKTQQSWKKEWTAAEEEIAALQKQVDEQYAAIGDLREEAEQAQQKAMRKYDINVFLIRLLVILPLLLLGIFFAIKFRKHKYWPLFLGYILFSFYAFFVGLVPYLPSYGGYIRYTVGVALSVLLGIYAINSIRKFIDRKKQELKVSKEERAQKVQVETAEKALENHMCPSCGKDFLIRDWSSSGQKGKQLGLVVKVTNFCRYCGLELFKACNHCGEENYAHLPYCSKCGEKASG